MWSTERPTVPGWWWFKHEDPSDGREVFRVEMINERLLVFTLDGVYEFEVLRGEW